MTRSISVYCNKCGDAVLENVSVIAVTAGPLRSRHEVPIDLCPACGDRFCAWLRSSPQGEAWNDLETKVEAAQC